MAGAAQVQCVICSNNILASDAVRLPCSCTASYCQDCWQRALLKKNQCPTCRSHLTPEFNVAAGKSQLIASNIPIEELRQQARDSQLGLLRENRSASGTMKCMCGDKLKELTVEERCKRSKIGCYVLSCGLCDRYITRTFCSPGDSHVWTCSKGQDLQLHPAPFDVCTECIKKHAQPECEQPGSTSVSEDADSCGGDSQWSQDNSEGASEPSQNQRRGRKRISEVSASSGEGSQRLQRRRKHS